MRRRYPDSYRQTTSKTLVSGDLVLLPVAKPLLPVANNRDRLIKHARYYWLLLAEGHLNRRLFGDMLRRIWALPVPGG